MDNLINYAVAYAEKGFYVLPMHRKKPMIEFADRPAMTADEIKRFWTTHPQAQIALRTVHHFVVDIDQHDDGADGFLSFNTFEHPEYFEDTLSQTTAGGGMQIFYLKPDGVEIPQIIGWLPGVDIKAHTNNYTMVAPSRTEKGQYKWDCKHSIVEASDGLIAELTKQKFTESKYQPEALSAPVKKSATAELFEQVVNGLGETGGRNNALAAFVGGLLFRDVSVDAVLALAKQANDNTPKSLDGKEFARTFESMVKKEIRRREKIAY